jgi:hypothetical protein
VADVTFPSSYLTEKLKLGDATKAQSVKKQLGLEALTAREAGLSLSFSEDRALTAVQSLFAFGGFQPHEMVTLTSQAQEQWGCVELPVMVAEAKAYCRAYAQGGDVTADAALTTLKALASRHFYLAYTDGPESLLRCLYAPVLAVQKYKLRGVRRPTHLRVALTPVLLQGVYPAVTGFRPKRNDLHAKLVTVTGSKLGRPPEQLLRLTAWIMTLPKRPTVHVTDQTLAERLRSQTLQHSQVGKFRRTLEQHFEIMKQLGMLKGFKPPTSETAGKWLIKLQ